MPADIGRLNEGALHQRLKELYTEDGDEIECPMNGFVVDIKKEDRIIEIETNSLQRVARKIDVLTRTHPVHVVYPIAQRTTIAKTLECGRTRSRKSPKRGTIYEVFSALVSAPNILEQVNFSLEVPLIHEEQVRVFDRTRAWRRRHWVIQERRLVKILDSHHFEDNEDLWKLFRGRLPAEFTTKNVSENVNISRRLAQQSVYCLRKCGIIRVVGKNGNELIYREISVD